MTMKKIDFSEIEHNQWFKEALIERAKAQYELGMRFFDGNGVRKSEKEAMKCNAPHFSRVTLRKSGKKVCFRVFGESVMPG